MPQHAQKAGDDDGQAHREPAYDLALVELLHLRIPDMLGASPDRIAWFSLLVKQRAQRRVFDLFHRSDIDIVFHEFEE